MTNSEPEVIADCDGGGKNAVRVDDEPGLMQQHRAPWNRSSMNSDPKTTDYCMLCGCSPDSGCHLFNHTYQDPRSLPPEQRKKANPKCPVCGVHLCVSVHEECRKLLYGSSRK